MWALFTAKGISPTVIERDWTLYDVLDAQESLAVQYDCDHDDRRPPGFRDRGHPAMPRPTVDAPDVISLRVLRPGSQGRVG